MPIYLQFATRRAVLAFHSQSSPSGYQIGNCCLITGIFYAIGISSGMWRCSPGFSSYFSLGFSRCSISSYIFEHYKVLAVDHDQNIYGWKKRERFASLLYGQDKDGQCFVGNRVLFSVFFMCSLDLFSVISHFVEKDLWVSFSSLPVST